MTRRTRAIMWDGMGAPTLPTKEPAANLRPMTIRLPLAMKQELEAIAAAHHLSLGAVCLRFLEASLEEWRKAHPKK